MLFHTQNNSFGKAYDKYYSNRVTRRFNYSQKLCNLQFMKFSKMKIFLKDQHTIILNFSIHFEKRIKKIEEDKENHKNKNLNNFCIL